MNKDKILGAALLLPLIASMLFLMWKDVVFIVIFGTFIVLGMAIYGLSLLTSSPNKKDKHE